MLIKQNQKFTALRDGVNIFTASIICIGFTLFATPSFAAQAMMPSGFKIKSLSVPVSVKIDRRDLETPRGVTQVYAKLKHRADSACARQGVTPLENARLKKPCSAALLSEFVTNIDDERLTKYHALKVSS